MLLFERSLYIFNCEKEKFSYMQGKRATSVWYMAKYNLSCFTINCKSIELTTKDKINIQSFSEWND